MPILKCEPLVFLSILDEDLFFQGLKRISAVKKVEGRGNCLFTSIAARPSQKALRELVGLFYRFGIEMDQLAQFVTEENRQWFCSPTAYWFRRVFKGRMPHDNQTEEPRDVEMISEQGAEP